MFQLVACRVIRYSRRMHSRTLFITLFLLAASPALAVRTAVDSSNKPDLSAAGVTAAEQLFRELEGETRSKTVAQVETYLTGLSSVVANFTQTASDGSTGSGTFYMKRPGKICWQYNAPAEQLLVSNGKTLTYYDLNLKQVTYVPVDDTLAGFVAQQSIKLDSKTTKLTHVMSNALGMLRVTLVQRKKPSEGSLTLEFSGKPIKISKLTSLDATGNETQVTLVNPQFGPVLDDKLFIFNDPRGINDRRNRTK